MKMYILPLGDCCCMYEIIAPGVADGRRVHIPVPGYLVELDSGELALIDTGMSRLHIEDPERTWRGHDLEDKLIPVMRPEDNLALRLAEMDITPQDVRYVINTHLHFDHAGNNDLLSKATFFVQREHYEFAKDNPMFPNQYWNLPALKYELLDGATTLFPGVETIPTPGHAPGHQSVLLRLGEGGNVVVCGDAVYCQENFDYDSWGGQADPGMARESAHVLLQVGQKEGATLLYGHDGKQRLRLQYAPREFAGMN